jgi:hypothetical protein
MWGALPIVGPCRFLAVDDGSGPPAAPQFFLRRMDLWKFFREKFFVGQTKKDNYRIVF